MMRAHHFAGTSVRHRQTTTARRVGVCAIASVPVCVLSHTQRLTERYNKYTMRHHYQHVAEVIIIVVVVIIGGVINAIIVHIAGD